MPNPAEQFTMVNPDITEEAEKLSTIHITTKRANGTNEKTPHNN